MPLFIPDREIEHASASQAQVTFPTDRALDGSVFRDRGALRRRAFVFGVVSIMDQKLKADWIKALRSGEFEQDFMTTGFGKKCCVIGVGGAVAGLDVDRSTTGACAKALGLTQEEVNRLTTRNDDDRMPFPELADYIEANL